MKLSDKICDIRDIASNPLSDYPKEQQHEYFDWVKAVANGEAVDILIDSSGLSFGRASQWYEVKYGKKASVTPWRKMHLSIDPEMNVHGIAITDTAVSDSEGMELVMPGEVQIAKVIADGAYYSIERGEALTGLETLQKIATSFLKGSDLDCQISRQRFLAYGPFPFPFSGF